MAGRLSAEIDFAPASAAIPRRRVLLATSRPERLLISVSLKTDLDDLFPPGLCFLCFSRTLLPRCLCACSESNTGSSSSPGSTPHFSCPAGSQRQIDSSLGSLRLRTCRLRCIPCSTHRCCSHRALWRRRPSSHDDASGDAPDPPRAAEPRVPGLPDGRTAGAEERAHRS